MKQHLCFIASLGICLFGLNAAADAQQIKAETGGIATGLLGAIRSRVNLRSQGALFGSKSNNARGALPEF
jgi:hypothetical protein